MYRTPQPMPNYWSPILNKALKGEDGYSLDLEYQVARSLFNPDDYFFEALLRLKEPQSKDRISAGRFIDAIAPNEALMLEIDQWVLGQVSRRIAKTKDRIAINMSQWFLRKPLVLQTIGNALRNEGAIAERLILEINERCSINDGENDILKMLQKQGNVILLDDMGSQSARHSPLWEMIYPWVGGIKIDIALTSLLLHESTEGRRSRAIVGGLIRMCAESGLVCVLEGIETQEQIEWIELRSVGAQVYLQGWAVN